jgi:hypothetical protein
VAPVDRTRRDAASHALSAVANPRLVAARSRGRAASLLVGLLLRQPYTVRRHRLAPVAREVSDLLRTRIFDVVVCEQAQALGSVTPALRAGVPVVLRAHNVESRLWRFMAASSRPPRSTLFAVEAERLASWERRHLGRVAVIAAISPADLRVLDSAVAGRTRVELVPAPFPARLPAGDRTLPGAPAAVVLASAWAPGQAAVRALARDWWPRVRARLPAAHLHAFGPIEAAVAADGVSWHPSPIESRDAFPSGAIAVMPPRHPTGVPVKALEAWARGLPVVADSATADALEVRDRDALLAAEDGDGLAAALVELAGDPELGPRLVTTARQRLGERHAPRAIAGRLLELVGLE